MNLLYDIGIFYCSRDNNSIHEDGNGWVTSFHKFLTALLAQISRDNNLKIALINEKNIQEFVSDQFSVIIPILSNDFFSEDLLVKQVINYHNNLTVANQSVEGTSRVFKVLKSPVEGANVLEGLENVLGYDFYRIDPATGNAQEFNRFFGSDAERQFWMKLVDMAYDLHHVIKAEEKIVESSQAALSKEKTVYLASTGVDMVIQRDIVKRELIRHGYRVLPEHTLPKEEEALRRMIRADLAESRLSIHLVGEDYGYKPMGSEMSVVDIQNAVAEEHNFAILDKNKKGNEKHEFNRLIWIPPNMKNVSERQQIFIEDLISNAALLDEAEVLRIPLQELKSIIRSELVTTGVKNQQEISEEAEKSTTSVYVIYDKLDQKTCKPILNSLNNKGYKLLQPTFEGNFVDIRYVHQENLRRCDALLIFQGSATEEWVVTKVQDVMKSPGFGREKPLKANALCLKDAESYNPELISRSKAMVITGINGSFSEEALNPFFSKLT